MKRAILSYGLAAILAAAACAPSSSAADAPSKMVCIPSYLIDHTRIPDDSTIVFYMRDHKVWKNTLIGSCAGLKINLRGFTYSPTSPGTDEICSNLVSIRLNDTGQVCLLGAFTPVEPSGATH